MTSEPTDAAGSLHSYRIQIEQFTEDQLRPYLDHLRESADSDAFAGFRSTKEFNDPVWGTILLTPVELVVLDSPLLQRLRRIRQLGVGHLVYPGAQHSRFEHSIGVCNQVGRLVRSMNDHAVADGENAPFNAILTQRLRLAGLVHDVGHGLMSHVSENALRTRSIERLTVQFKRELRRNGNPQLSEMAAYYMLRSPAFKDLVKLAYELSGTAPDHHAAEAVASMVAGIRVDDQFPLIHQLISGPFDADKLDYMARDAAMCGVPAVTDVNRLVQKMRAVVVPADQLPSHLKNQVSKTSWYTITGVARSGARAIDEVVLGRTLMFDKVYRHHKVRAAEAMITSILSSIAEAHPEDAPTLPLRWTDDEFTSLSPAALEELLPPGTEGADSAPEVLRRLLDRDLFVRAYAFAQRRPANTQPLSQDEKLESRALADKLGTPEGRREFVDQVVAEVEVIHELVPIPMRSRLPGASLTPYVWVDPPANVPEASNETRAYLIEDDRTIREVKNVIPDLRAWADAYINTREVGYLFAPREIAEAVAMATEVVMLREYGVRPTEIVNAYARVDRGDAVSLRSKLAGAGYFDTAPRELRPEPDALTRAGSAERLQRIAIGLSGYQGPTRNGNDAEPGSAVTAELVRTWVKQFPDDLVAPALTALEHVRIIDRSIANDSLAEFFAAHPEFENPVVTPLGDPKDGASVLAYFSLDTAQAAGVPLMSLNAAILHDGPIIFVDDVVGRGAASIEYFEGILGLPSTTSLNQAERLALPPAAQEQLRKKKIAIVYCTGLEGGAGRVEAKLTELGLDVTTYVRHPPEWIPTIATVVESEHPEHFEAFSDESRRVGLQLLQDKTDWEATTREDRALGYGNHGALLVSSFNTPTVTLTALWKRGIVDGIPWEPLLPRRDKG